MTIEDAEGRGLVFVLIFYGIPEFRIPAGRERVQEFTLGLLVNELTSVD